MEERINRPEPGGNVGTSRAPLPDEETCRTRHGFCDYWECLAVTGRSCPFRMSFGYTQLCLHEDARRFSDES